VSHSMLLRYLQYLQPCLALCTEVMLISVKDTVILLSLTTGCCNAGSL